MLVKTLLNKCETGFDIVIVADITSGHTMEFSSVKEARIVAGGYKVISWEVGVRKDIVRQWVLFITI